MDKERLRESILSPQGMDTLTYLMQSFVEAQEETFKLFDSEYDTQAESDAAKAGWSTVTSSVALFAMDAALKSAMRGVDHV